MSLLPPATVSYLLQGLVTCLAWTVCMYARIHICVSAFTSIPDNSCERGLVNPEPSLVEPQHILTATPQRSSRYEPARPAIMKNRKMGLWGNPGPPNSGSSPSAPGK